MPLLVERDPEFADDLRAQLRYLSDRGELEWIATLDEDVLQAEQVLAQFPEAGRALANEGRPAVRRLRLRRAPYVVWYTPAQRKRVVLLRLFHVRQKGPAS